MKIPCAVCDSKLDNLKDFFGGGDNQPINGTEFRTFGHYGSGVFDPMDGSELVLNICDECLSKIMNKKAAFICPEPTKKSSPSR